MSVMKLGEESIHPFVFEIPHVFYHVRNQLYIIKIITNSILFCEKQFCLRTEELRFFSGNQDIYKSAENCMESLYTSNVYNRYSSCVKLVILRKNVSIFNSMGQKVTLKCNIMSYNGLIYTASSHLWFDGLKYVSMLSFISRVKQYVWYVFHYLDWGFFYCHILGHR